MKINTSYIGLIPAAGSGTRLKKISFSKELLKLGPKDAGDHNKKVVSSFLIDHYRNAGVKEIHLILRKDKMDIQNHYGDGNQWGVHIFYHFTGLNAGVPFSINTAYNQYKDKRVLFGFPDILFYPKDAFSQMKKLLEGPKEFDVVLGLFPVSERGKWDTVEVSKQLEIKKVWIKEDPGDHIQYGWVIAAWKPSFSAFLRKKVEVLSSSITGGSPSEVYIGHIIQQAIEEGLKVGGCPFNSGACLDVGTPEGLSMSGQFIEKHFNVKK